MSNSWPKSIFDTHKLINLLIFFIVILYVLYYPVFIEAGRCTDYCPADLKQAVLDPLYLSLQYLVYLLATLLVLPPRYFHRWLLYVASWGLPLLFILVGSSSPYSSGIMTGRAFDAQLGTILFVGFSAVATVGFIIYDFWQWYRSDKTLRDI